MECVIDMIDDVEEFIEVISETMPTARKEHKCGECHETIGVGDEYEVIKGRFQGDLVTYKTCLICREIRDELFCSWRYEMIWEDLSERDYTPEIGDLLNFSPAAQQKLIEKLVIDDPWFEDDDEV